MSVNSGLIIRSLARYAIGLLAVGVAFALRRGLAREFGELPPYITFYPAVMVTALFGGWGPGLLATALAALAVDIWILSPNGHAPLSASNAIGLGLFVVMGACLSAVVELYHRSRQRVAAFERDLVVQAELRKLNRTLRALGKSNHALLHAADEPELLQAVCRIIVEDCGHAMVWIGYAEEDENKSVRPVASAGFEAGYLETLNITWADSERGRGPTGVAIRTGQPAGCRDMLSDPRFAPWRAEALRRGYASSLVLPLLECGRAFGAITIYAPVPDAFSEDEISLLRELAGDLAHGIGAMRLRTANRLSQEALRSVALFPEQNPSPVLRIDSVGGLLFANQAARAMLAWMDWREGLPLPDPFAKAAGRALQARSVWEMEVLCRAGLAFSFVVTPIPGENYVNLYGRDITKRKRSEANQCLMTEILRLLNRDDGDLRRLFNLTLHLIREWTGFDAVGLRLRNGDDSPYFVQLGFPEDFLREENSLCPKREDGSATRDEEGRPVLECTCGLVLSGRADPTMPCFSEGGSFWTNNSTGLLAVPHDEDPRTNPRNRCTHAGFQSVALVPVRSGSDIIGLLQLNDRREGRFTLDMIQFFEGLADNLGLAIKRKQAEDGLRKANTQLAETDKCKDEFLAMLAHELRNPLAPIRNAVQILKLVGPQEPVLVKNRDIIERQTAHMGRLLDDLLDVSRVTRGKIVLRRETLDLRTVVIQAVEVAAHSVNGRRIEIHYGNPPDPLLLEGDFTRLEQVVGNLLNNALKYTDEGWIRVGIECFPDRESDCPWAALRVCDTGIGIAPDVLPRIFDLFAQADQTLERTRGGLGIGLTMVKTLVELHGGRVEARSPGLGQGSEFTIFLPLLDRARVPDAPACDEPAGPATESIALKVLVVDDNIDAANSLKDLLEMWGFGVRAAHDGPDAVQQALSFIPDVILLDIGLPGMSGYAVARRLRAEPALESVKLIALTGYGQAEDRKMTSESGFDAHLVKPVDLQHLQALLSRIAVG